MPTLHELPTYDGQSAEQLLLASEAFDRDGFVVVDDVFSGELAAEAAPSVSDVFPARASHLCQQGSSLKDNGIEVATIRGHQVYTGSPIDQIRRSVLVTGANIGAVITPYTLDKELRPIHIDRREKTERLFTIEPGKGIKIPETNILGDAATTLLRGLGEISIDDEQAVALVPGRVVYFNGGEHSITELTLPDQDNGPWNLAYVVADQARNRAF